MDTILQGKFTNYNHEDRDYPSVQSIKKVGYLPDPRPTVASLAVIHAREKKEEQAKPKHFIMKKFQNVKGERPLIDDGMMNKMITFPIDEHTFNDASILFFVSIQGKMQTEREFAASQNNEEPTSYE
jgi:hypothetical protein